jgi:hypothetical protein
MTDAWDWMLGRVARVQWRVQTLAVLLAFRNVDLFTLGFDHGYRDGFHRERRAAKRDWHKKSREDGYSIGYRHGKRDSGVLKLVVDNEAAPVNLYPARHAASG